MVTHDGHRLQRTAALCDHVLDDEEFFAGCDPEVPPKDEVAPLLLREDEAQPKLTGDFLPDDEATHRRSHHRGGPEMTEFRRKRGAELLHIRHLLKGQGALEELPAMQPAAEDEMAFQQGAGFPEDLDHVGISHGGSLRGGRLRGKSRQFSRRRIRISVCIPGCAGKFRPMPELANPALTALVEALKEGLVLVQVVITPHAGGFRLRHTADAPVEWDQLQSVPLNGLRLLAQFTDAGAFRPLKAAPTLKRGWRIDVSSPGDLGLALQQLYPGAVADWFAALHDPVPVTHYRDFVNRQTGMYRVTQILPDERAAQVARASCRSEHCLKRRLWTVPGLEPDGAGAKSVVPCLEPCQVVLEFARKAMKIDQEDRIELKLAPSELASIKEALAHAAAHPEPGLREGDVAPARSVRRVRLLLAKLDGVGTPTDDSEDH